MSVFANQCLQLKKISNYFIMTTFQTIYKPFSNTIQIIQIQVSQILLYTKQTFPSTPPTVFIICYCPDTNQVHESFFPLHGIKYAIVHGIDLICCHLSHVCWQKGSCTACFPAAWHLFLCTAALGQQLLCVASTVYSLITNSF